MPADIYLFHLYFLPFTAAVRCYGPPRTFFALGGVRAQASHCTNPILHPAGPALNRPHSKCKNLIVASQSIFAQKIPEAYAFGKSFTATPHNVKCSHALSDFSPDKTKSAGNTGCIAEHFCEIGREIGKWAGV
jgi:hypothetical protein